jgi:hypothetical protein
MCFHGAFLGSQPEIWSKQHNGKVSPDLRSHATVSNNTVNFTLSCVASVSQNPRILLVIPLQSSRSTFLGEVCSAFLPSKKACWAHQFRYLGVDQQYPTVFCDSTLRSDYIAERGVLTGCRVRHITALSSWCPAAVILSMGQNSLKPPLVWTYQGKMA